ncbi:MAG: hypothetical protein Q9191_006538 [Dirinaria sp. TL-2023a]
MGFKSDQNLFSSTYRPSQNPDGSPLPPPLPPRVDQSSQTSSLDPPSYTESGPVFYSQPLTGSWSAQDPRSSSAQSLIPENSSNDGKRRLLLVYIHGFMGNETSFQSFPAHIHNLVTVKLAETHQVHTKIYPKYKSRKAIEYARDDFSKWLRPHESPETDVILAGHSMGGLLSAEVALLGQSTNASETSFQHRILGTINLDTPFLGIHPGVIGSGIGSLFRPAPDAPAPEGTSSQRSGLNQASTLLSTGNDNMPVMERPALSSENHDSLSGQSISFPTDSDTTILNPVPPFLVPANDPNYNPTFPNDVRKTSRKGWENALHFVKKHSDGLMRATRSYVTSYFEFGGCLADYNGLRDRYSRLRKLEENDYRRRDGQRRVRFVNYYTASTGRPKRQKSRPTSPAPAGTRLGQDSDTDVEPQALEQRLQDISVSTSEARARSTSPHIPSTELTDDDSVPEIPIDAEDILGIPPQEAVSSSNAGSETEPAVGAASMPDQADKRLLSDETLRTMSEQDPALSLEPSTSASIHHEINLLPPIPPQPQAPAAFDPVLYPERDARKLAEKNHARQLKAYQRAIKDRDNAIKDRRKFLEKREKAAQQSREKQLKREGKPPPKQKKKKKNEKDDPRQQTSLSASTSHQSHESGVDDDNDDDDEVVIIEQKKSDEKPKRDKKFCMLPSSKLDEPDPCWVRVYMRGVDEVGAHCGLFCAQGETYEWLVRDVGERIKDWVFELR